MEFETISANKLSEYIGNNDVIIIDIRSPSEYYKGHIPTAINIPYKDFNNIKKQIPKKTLILYCDRGGTSMVLARDLSKEGYKVKNVYGGIKAYRGQLE